MTAGASLGRDYFERLYAADEDPWRFRTSAYERAKYDDTLDALEGRRFGSGVEVGCSIGELTAILGVACDRLLGVDIAEAPLALARLHNAASPHLAFARMALPDETPPGRFDLIVLSEVLYYFAPADLARVAAWAKGALAPGGRVLMVHWPGEAADYPLGGNEAVEGFVAAAGPELAVDLSRRRRSIGWIDWPRRCRRGAMPPFPPLARPEILALRSSKIREVANASLGRADVLAFWFGESDRVTPDFIREAAVAALREGRTFYTHNLGRADLREALCTYLARLHGRAFGLEQVAVTSSGVNALMVVAQALLSPGDRVVVVDPVWPNVAEIPKIMGAQVATVPIRPSDGRFALDLDRLMDALTPDTRALFLNSPNNPTGWTLPAEHRAAVLERCRRHGTWLVADDVYERLYFGEAASAPSFLPLAETEDRLVSANSFSKAWRMTGWRLGWLVAPPALVERLGVLLEYNTSCAPDFVQSAAVVALEQGEPHVAAFRAELAVARDRLLGALNALGGVEAPAPDGGLYAFFRLAGCEDSLATAKRLVDGAGLGLAPGAAFGDDGEGWLRWCFAARPDKLQDGLARITAHLGR